LGENPKPATTLNQTPVVANTIQVLRMLHCSKKELQNLPSILKDSIAGNKDT
jgi:hypothetical protein